MIFAGSVKQIKVLTYDQPVFVRKLTTDTMNEMFRLMRETAKAATGDADFAQGDLVAQSVWLLLCEEDGSDATSKWENLKPEPFDALQSILAQGMAHNHLTDETFAELAGNLPATESDSDG